jgi:hypothetical protein
MYTYQWRNLHPLLFLHLLLLLLYSEQLPLYGHLEVDLK